MRVTAAQFEAKAPAAFAAWKALILKRQPEITDFYIAPGGEPHVTNDCGMHWENYQVWERGEWRPKRPDEIGKGGLA